MICCKSPQSGAELVSSFCLTLPNGAELIPDFLPRTAERDQASHEFLPGPAERGQAGFMFLPGPARARKGRGRSLDLLAVRARTEGRGRDGIVDHPSSQSGTGGCTLVEGHPSSGLACSKLRISWPCQKSVLELLDWTEGSL